MNDILQPYPNPPTYESHPYNPSTTSSIWSCYFIQMCKELDWRTTTRLIKQSHTPVLRRGFAYWVLLSAALDSTIYYVIKRDQTGTYRAIPTKPRWSFLCKQWSTVYFLGVLSPLFHPVFHSEPHLLLISYNEFSRLPFSWRGFNNFCPLSL